MAKKRTAKREPRTKLAELRRDVVGRTQVQLAGTSGMQQADISRLEGRATLDEIAVSTLRRYVAGLGGELRLVAMIDGKAHELTGNDDE